MATLPKNISVLSQVEKFELLDALWEDLEANRSELDASLAAELDLRVAAYEQNLAAVVSWDQVKAEQPKL